ncbi:hypothetical protein [Hymenobacter fodinae]|uniref:Uncharacterized protein n=1 Tax=Hymenobacter fodinae TaxID=2510796 RepID=A0A4Z0P2Q2_9BACT|nr:hypothetical protein [Hymenobacter fodinae]TGE05531.1 hypothetical protein EU556_19720 [Hymenobacter fodinae]
MPAPRFKNFIGFVESGLARHHYSKPNLLLYATSSHSLGSYSLPRHLGRYDARAGRPPLCRLQQGRR